MTDQRPHDADQPDKRQPRRTLGARVVSCKADKTATVMVERQIQHPLYKKYIRRSTKLHVHDENNECRDGDTVLLQECRPLSKTKNWLVLEVVGRAGQGKD